MKVIVRTFFKALRIILGPFMLLGESLTRPKGMLRAPQRQQQVDQECQALALYQFRTCPFCIKVRHEIHRLSLTIRCVDAQTEGAHRHELLQGGGEVKVPCLRITNDSGDDQWLYESGKIIAYLRCRFADADQE